MASLGAVAMPRGCGVARSHREGVRPPIGISSVAQVVGSWVQGDGDLYPLNVTPVLTDLDTIDRPSVVRRPCLYRILAGTLPRSRIVTPILVVRGQLENFRESWVEAVAIASQTPLPARSTTRTIKPAFKDASHSPLVPPQHPLLGPASTETITTTMAKEHR